MRELKTGNKGMKLLMKKQTLSQTSSIETIIDSEITTSKIKYNVL